MNRKYLILTFMITGFALTSKITSVTAMAAQHSEQLRTINEKKEQIKADSAAKQEEINTLLNSIEPTEWQTLTKNYINGLKEMMQKNKDKMAQAITFQARQAAQQAGYTGEALDGITNVLAAQAELTWMTTYYTFLNEILTLEVPMLTNAKEIGGKITEKLVEAKVSELGEQEITVEPAEEEGEEEAYEEEQEETPEEDVSYEEEQEEAGGYEEEEPEAEGNYYEEEEPAVEETVVAGEKPAKVKKAKKAKTGKKDKAAKKAGKKDKKKKIKKPKKAKKSKSKKKKKK